MNATPNRCPWSLGSPAYIAYHDDEWGRPCHDERTLFAFLNLEGAQAGLSWSTILKKREGYRRAFADWDPVRIAAFDEADFARLLADPGIVRNRLKVAATIANAQALLRLHDSGDTLDGFAWRFVDGQPQVNHWRSLSEVPAETSTSKAMSKALQKLGFRFVGGTIMYAWMQAMGLVNDHLVDCHCHPEAANRER